VTGNVLATLAFSRAAVLAANTLALSASGGHSQSSAASEMKTADDAQFGCLLPFYQGLLLSYTDSLLLLVDLGQNGRIISVQHESIADLAVNRHEIFVLRKCSGGDADPLVKFALRNPEEDRHRSMPPPSQRQKGLPYLHCLT
jgi:hypothetical protein